MRDENKKGSVATAADPLLRHLTGEYLGMVDAMTPADVIYWAHTCGKKTFMAADILKLVDEARKPQTSESIEKLLQSGKLVQADANKPDRLKLA